MIKISGKDNLEIICRELTSKLHTFDSDEGRLRYLLKHWRFRLPMASAILTVYNPTKYTVYDSRVCGILGKFEKLKNGGGSDNQIRGYFDFVIEVELHRPKGLKLRDKDRFLWSESRYQQLENDIKMNFKK